MAGFIYAKGKPKILLLMFRVGFPSFTCIFGIFPPLASPPPHLSYWERLGVLSKSSELFTLGYWPQTFLVRLFVIGNASDGIPKRFNQTNRAISCFMWQGMRCVHVYCFSPVL